jgi:hypothetical protein
MKNDMGNSMEVLCCPVHIWIRVPSNFLTSQFGFYFSVFTPYYSEIVLYSLAELQKKNEDGISILFYLQKIFPGLYLLEDILYFSFNYLQSIYIIISFFIVQIIG